MNNSDNIEVSILGFLYSQPKHGYDLHKDISDLSGIGIVWKVKMGRLYAMLHRLEKENWIAPEAAQEGNRPQRTQYSIMPEGREVFDAWVRAPIQHGRDFRILFLLKLYFALEKSENQAQQLLSDQIGECTSWLTAYQAQNAEASGGRDFNVIVNNYRLSQINGHIEWLNWCKETINGETK
jgi:DNA-binding PadR family transcriptional regulator